jgi:hypothetical protein
MLRAIRLEEDEEWDEIQFFDVAVGHFPSPPFNSLIFVLPGGRICCGI